jgi:hypothetical protein
MINIILLRFPPLPASLVLVRLLLQLIIALCTSAVDKGIERIAPTFRSTLSTFAEQPGLGHPIDRRPLFCFCWSRRAKIACPEYE